MLHFLFDGVPFPFDPPAGSELSPPTQFEQVLGFAVLYFLLFIGAARHNRLERALDRLVRELAKTAFRQKHSPDETPVHVIVPAYNEADNIASVLRRVPKEACGLRTKTIVVVDGATDDTAAIVNSLNLPAVLYVINRGGGSALKAGYEHTCALLGSGQVSCWGYNGSGQLGDGTSTSHNAPVTISGF